MVRTPSDDRWRPGLRDVGLVLLAGGTAATLYAVWLSTDPRVAVPNEPSTTVSAARPAAPTELTTSPSSSSASPPSSSGPASASVSGPGISEPGVFVVARPDAAGVLEVVERVRLPSRLSEVALTLPQSFGIASLAHPTAVDLQAAADGNVVAVPDSGTVRQRVNLVLPQPADTLELRYRLVDAVQRSRPAPPGRALIIVAPLKVEVLTTQPVMVSVTGAHVTNLTCPLLPQRQQVCGRQDERGWFAPALAGDAAVVIVQVDLPNPT